MEITIMWRLNEKNGKWIILVVRDGQIIALILRKSEEECVAWAEKNMPVYSRGGIPKYG